MNTATLELHDHANPLYGKPWSFAADPIQDVSNEDKPYDFIVWYSYMDGGCEWHSCREFFNTRAEAEAFVKERQ